jgi:hypothetical protein
MDPFTKIAIDSRIEALRGRPLPRGRRGHRGPRPN